MRLLRRGHARHHGTAEPGGPAPQGPGPAGPVSGLRPGPGEEHPLHPEPRAPARRTQLGSGLLHPVRRAEPHDPVQTEVPAARRQHHRRPLHLPGPYGGGHPALSDGPGPRGRGPAPARGAVPGHRPAVQRRLQRHFHPAGSLHPAGGPGSPDHEPGQPPEQNEQVRPRRLRQPDGLTGGHPAEVQAGRHRQRDRRPL